VAAWLLGGMLVLAWVVARQSASLDMAGQLRAGQEERSALEAERALLQRRIREAGSRVTLVRRAEDLGLRQPADSDIVFLRVPNLVQDGR